MAGRTPPHAGAVMSRGGGHLRRIVAAALWALALDWFAGPVEAGIVERAEIRDNEKYADVEIRFNAPIAIAAYAPRAHGRLLQIGVELPAALQPDSTVRLGATEWVAGSQANAYTLYEYLRFDRTREPARGRIVIRFLHDVDFTVYKSADARGIVISILKADVPKQRPQKLPGQSQLLAATAPAPEPQAVSAETAPETRETKAAVALTAIPSAPAAPVPTEKAAAVAPAVGTRAPGERPYTALAEPIASATRIAAVTQAAIATKPRRRSSRSDGWRVYGSFAQYYDYGDVKISRSGDPRFATSDTRTSQNDLRSYLDLGARYRDDDWDLRSRFSGGYRVDFLDHSQDTFKSHYAGNKFLLSNAYVDVRARNADITAKVGRQYGSSGGVFGRYDGAQVGVPLAADWRVNVVAGTPVDLTSDKTVDDTSRYFYGANIDFAPRGSRWQSNVYAMQQMIDGIVDRRAVGNETHYYGEERSLLTLLDYDIEYRVLNRAFAIGTWTPFKPTSLNLTLDYGYSPLLTTRNALISQPNFSSITALRRIYSDAEIEQLARDRTAKYHNVLIGVTQQLDEAAQLYGSVGQYYYGAMPASGDVPALPATGNEYDYTLQYMRSNLFSANDTHLFGLRYYDGNSVRRIAAGIDARYSWESWMLNPRLWVERRDNLNDNSNEWVYRPGLRLEYSFARRYHLELEASTDIYHGSIPNAGNQDIIGNFVEAGYRVDFE